MAAALPPEEHETITRAFSGLGGLGVDERSLVSIIAKWRHEPEKKTHLRRNFLSFFKPHGNFERCDDDYVDHLRTEFSRFEKITVLWAMHPWERDARWVHQVLEKAEPLSVLIEVACTRSSEELLGARKAYHALFHKSIEEDVAYHVKESHSNLLLGLVSAYRYEGAQVNEDVAKSEAKTLGNVIKSASASKLLDNQEVIRILTTRSKPHLQLIFKYYKEVYGESFDEDAKDELCLQETVQCLDSPPTYFSKVINKAFEDQDKTSKEALTRVVVSRAHEDMEAIKETYHKQYGVKLEDVIVKNTHGNYKDALLSLVGN